jgi:putative CocE/NonD family hydrolase
MPSPGRSPRHAGRSLPMFALPLLAIVLFTAAGRDQDVKMEFDRRVPMRDGVTLSADVYRPDAPGRFPVILVRTPYDNGTAPNVVRGRFWASHGYVYVVQDVRGRGDSDGEFYPLTHEAEDGYDTQTWCADQPWSNGKVGMTGSSYLGWVQVYAAGLRNPALAAMVPIVTPPDPIRNFPVQFGVFGPTSVSWLVMLSGKTNQDISQLDLTRAHNHLPLREIDELLGRRIKAWRDWFDHPTLDEYWEKQAYQEKLLDEQVPALHISGWYDDVLVGTTENYVNLTTRAKEPNVRKRQWLLIGPWGHAVNVGTKLGRIDFGPQAVIDLDELQLRWFDHWLKGVDNGIEKEPAVRVFVMGENRWETEQEWPIARTQYIKYFLHSNGHASSLSGNGTLSSETPANEPPDRFRYDPQDPAPFITEPAFNQVGGPDDYRPVERRDDVLVFTGPVVTEPLEICGPLRVKLYAASSARDTDWTAKVLDVHPDGFAQRLNDGIVRARFRKGPEKEEFLVPGAVEEYDIDCWSTCIVLGKGHRLRLEISSSAFPKFDRNLNTGGPIGKEAKWIVADQIVYHDQLRPSHVVVPVVPPRPERR